MNSQFTRQLPRVLNDLVREIEIYAGREIGVATNPNGPACQVDENQANICFIDPNAIDLSAAPHELLHIKRNWPDQVPVFVTNTGDAFLEQNVANIDNYLEHLVIVPLESSYGVPNPFHHWNVKAMSWWGKKRWAGMHVNDRRTNMLLRWLSINLLVSDTAIKTMAESALRAEGLLADAQQFSTAIGSVLDAKDKMVAATVTFLNIPRAHVALRKFDVRNGKAVDVPIPAWT